LSAILQLWDAPSCEPGAVCLGSLAPWQSATGSESLGTPAALRVTIPREVADAVGVADGQCIRVVSQSRGEQWWSVQQVTDGDGGSASSVTITAGPLRTLLTVRGLVRTTGAGSPAYRVTPSEATVTTLLNTLVLTNLAEDGLTWLSLGTIDATALLDLGTLDRVTRAGVLDRIEQATGHTARLRGLYTSGVLTGFAIDVVDDIAAGLDTVPLSVGAGIAQLTRTRDALRAATVALPFSTTGQPMDACEWVIDSVTGAGPAWVALRDPDAGLPFPIREDDQLNGYQLVQRDGTQTVITDSRASDSAAQVSTVGTLAAGQRVTILTSGGTFAPQAVTSPSGLAGPRGVLTGTVAANATDARRNHVANPVFGTWSSLTASTDWTHNQGTAGSPIEFQRYARTTPTTWTANISQAVTNGVTYTSLTFTGATANSVVFRGEVVTVLALGVGAFTVTLSATTQADGAGAGTISFNAVVYSGTTIPLGDGTLAVVSTGSNAQRPANFPSDGPVPVNVMRMGLGWTARASGVPVINTNPRVENTATLIPFDAARPFLFLRAGFTVKNYDSGVINDTIGNFMPAVALIEPGGTYGIVRASAQAAGTVPGFATAHVEASCSVQMTAALTVRAALYATPTQAVAGGAVSASGVTYARWVSMWLAASATETPMGVVIGSGSNAMWHRAQDVLQTTATGTRYAVAGLDLERLVSEVGALSLGQRVRLRAPRIGVDATVVIVKLDYDFAQTETLSAELGVIVPRLTQATVEL
jgi:hypothetical protein